MKLYWLIRYFVYKMKRQLGFITKWERKDIQATSGNTWEWCMFFYSLGELKRNLGEQMLKESYCAMKNSPNYKSR